MARRSISIDERIESAEHEVLKLKKKYDEAVAQLKVLVEKKKAMQSAGLMSAIERSGRSYEEILAFLQSKSEK